MQLGLVPYSKLAIILDSMRIFKMGYSWGGYESLLTPKYSNEKHYIFNIIYITRTKLE